MNCGSQQSSASWCRCPVYWIKVPVQQVCVKAQVCKAGKVAGPDKTETLACVFFSGLSAMWSNSFLCMGKFSLHTHYPKSCSMRRRKLLTHSPASVHATPKLTWTATSCRGSTPDQRKGANCRLSERHGQNWHQRGLLGASSISAYPLKEFIQIVLKNPFGSLVQN